MFKWISNLWNKTTEIEDTGNVAAQFSKQCQNSEDVTEQILDYHTHVENIQ